jgi:hypothetical protein
MNDLLAHIRNLNEKTTNWVNEDPTRRFAGLLIEDLNHWKEVNVTTPSELDHYLLTSEVYDLHKSVWGFRPNYGRLKSMTINELESLMDSLVKDLEREHRRKTLRRRLERKLRHAQHVTWVNRKRELLTRHVGFSIGELVSL